MRGDVTTEVSRYVAHAGGRTIPPSARVLIGIMSFASNKHSLERRMAIRSLTPHCPCAAVRFIMAAGEDVKDWGLGDIVQLRISKQSSFTGKYLLQNALLRFGAGLDVDFVMRVDDDTLLNVTHWTGRLLALREWGVRLVVGEFKSWYMWHEETRMPVCYAYNLKRWRDAQTYWTITPRGTNQTSRRINECRRNGTAGPFLFPTGPAAAFSQTLVRELVVVIDSRAEEAAVLNRSLNPMVNPHRDVVYPPGHPMHPSRKVMLEDVYLGFLLHARFGHVSSVRKGLKLVHVPIAEWSDKRGREPDSELRENPGYPLHGLKTTARFDVVRRHPEYLSPLGSPTARMYLSCAPLLLPGEVIGCCSKWESCLLLPSPQTGRPFWKAPPEITVPPDERQWRTRLAISNIHNPRAPQACTEEL